MIKNHITKNCQNFTPTNKEKYTGKYPIICRSTWEVQFCEFLDKNDSIIEWASEPVAVPYFNSITQKQARYYPDFLVKGKSKNGKTYTWLVEVKPYKECSPPTKRKGKKKSTLLYEEKTWKTNQSKWQAAKEFCKSRKWKFKIITERELFGKK